MPAKKGRSLNMVITVCKQAQRDEERELAGSWGGGEAAAVAHHCRDVDRPNEVTLGPSGHVALEDVGFGVDSGHFGAVVLEADLLHGSELPAGQQ